MAGGGSPLAPARAHTLAVLFTDLTGSTALFGRLGETAAERLRHAHLAALQQIVEGAGGRVVKGLGDGLMAAFTTASAACASARQMQQETELDNRRRGRDPLGLRIGVHVAEVVEDEGDLHGLAVAVAKRLCDRAQPGQVLVSDLAARVSASAEEGDFGAGMTLALKGVEAPIEVRELRWEPRPSSLDLPDGLAFRGAVAFVDRDELRARLAASWARARAGERRVALLAGEPGIGKSRLAAEVARAAWREGAVVLHGRCDSEPLRPYQPFAEAIAGYAEGIGPGRWDEHVGGAGGELLRLVPGPGRGERSSSRGNAEDERFRLFEAVRRLFGEIAGRAPVALVLDDVHWADAPTLRLLRHLTQTGMLTRTFVLGTYRDVEVGLRHPLSVALAELRRERGVERFELEGLGREEVEAFVTAAAGTLPDPAVASAIHHASAGNPLFAGEVVADLVDRRRLAGAGHGPEPPAVAVPETLREVLAARLGRLSPAAQEVLVRAAGIGQRFDFAVLARVVGHPEEHMLDALDEALAARLLREGEVPGAYLFTHALVHAALEGELSATRRARLHARIARELEQLHASDPDARAGEIAAHFRQAGHLADAGAAVHGFVRAAAVALRQTAFEEAVMHAEHALAVPPPDDTARAEALLARAAARVSLGEREAAADDCERAMALARDLRRFDLAARAAIILSGPEWGRVLAHGGLHARTVALLEQAVALAGARESTDVVRLLGRLSTELMEIEREPRRRRELLERAEAMAVRLDDEDAAFEVARERAMFAWGSPDLDATLRAAAELERLARRRGDPRAELLALVPGPHLRRGDRDEAERRTRRHEALTAELGLPHDRAVASLMRTLWALLDGPMAAAEQCLQAAMPLVARSGDQILAQQLAAQLLQLRWEQGRLAELEPAVELAAAQTPEVPAWRTAAAFVKAEQGKAGEARREIDALAPDGFAALPRDGLWLVGMANLAAATATAGAREHARVLAEALGPFADEVVVVGQGTVCGGAVARALGRLEILRGDWAAAARHLDHAREVHRGLRSPAWEAHTRVDRAELLLAAGGTGARDQALAELDAGRRAAEGLDMTGLLRRATALAESLAVGARP